MSNNDEKKSKTPPTTATVSLSLIPKIEYDIVVPQLLQFCEDKNLFENLPIRLNVCVRKRKDDLQAVEKFIIQLVDFDLFGMMLLFLHKNKNPSVYQILKEEVSENFWRNIWTGESKTQFYPTYGTNTSGYQKKVEWPFLPDVPSYKEEYKSLVPQRESIDRVLGTYSTFFAETYFQAMKSIVETEKKIRNFEKSINNPKACDNVVNEITEIQNWQFCKELKNLKSELKDFLQASTPSTTKVLEKVNFLKDHLKKLYKTYEHCYLTFLEIARSWGEYCSFEKSYLYYKENNKKIFSKKTLRSPFVSCEEDKQERLSNEFIEFHSNALVLIIICWGGQAKKLHWLAGHLFYIRLIKHLLEFIVECSKFKECKIPKKFDQELLYNFCILALREIWLAKTMLIPCDTILSNAWYGNPENLKRIDAKERLRDYWDFFYGFGSVLKPKNIFADNQKQIETSIEFAKIFK